VAVSRAAAGKVAANKLRVVKAKDKRQAADKAKRVDNKEAREVNKLVVKANKVVKVARAKKVVSRATANFSALSGASRDGLASHRA
jgi:hypothetical protein